MEEYKIYYDYNYYSMSLHWLIGILFMLLGYGIFKFPLRTKPQNPNQITYSNKFAGGLFVLGGALFTLVSGNKEILGYLEVKEMIKEKAFKTVAGEIKDFHPMPKGGHDLEHFTVNDIYFEYSDFEPIEGFNNTSSHGGPIQGNGQMARINYYTKDGRNYIIRLEIKEPTSTDSK